MNALGYSLYTSSADRFVYNGTSVLNGLKITPEAFSSLQSSLLLTPGMIGYQQFGAVNDAPGGWGSITLSASFAMSAVPEPQAHFLVGAGLMVVGLAGMKRRRRT